MTISSQHPTRQILIGAALELFATEGFRGTTVRKIEEAAGLSPGAGGMYRHFRSKDALLLAAVEHYRADVDRLQARIPDLLDLGDVRAELLLIAKLTTELNERNEALLRVLLLEGAALPDEAQQHFETIWNQAYALIAKWLERHMPDTCELDIPTMAITLFGSLAHYQAQEHTFECAPGGVTNEQFVKSWADHWSQVIAVAGAS